MFIDTAAISISGKSLTDSVEGNGRNFFPTWRNIVATLKGFSQGIEADTSQFSEYQKLKEQWRTEIINCAPKHLKGRLEFGDW